MTYTRLSFNSYTNNVAGLDFDSAGSMPMQDSDPV